MRVDRDHLENAALLLAFVIVSSSCTLSNPKSVPSCCTDLAANQELEELPASSEPEKDMVLVWRKTENNSIGVTLVDHDLRTTYFYSVDGGTTWRRDEHLQGIRDAATRRTHESIILPWEENPADPRVKYRTVDHPDGEPVNQRSTDAGKSWASMKSLLPSSTARLRWGGRTYYHPRDPLTFCVMGNLLDLKGRFGMYVTVDGGDTFKLLYESPLMGYISVSQSNPQIMYGAGIDGSLLKTSDGGQFWRIVGQNDLIRTTRVRKSVAANKPLDKPFHERPTYVHSISIDPVDVDRVYVTTSKGILRSENGGLTWCLIDAGISRADAIDSLVIVPGQPNTLLIGTYNGLMRSMDRGCHWEWIDVLSRVKE